MTKRIRPTVLSPAVLAAAIGAALFAPPAPARATGAEPLFVKHCAPCHGRDGKALNPAARKLGVKDLSVSKATDAEIEKFIIEGTKDPRGLPKMPSFKGKVSPEEIQLLVGWVKRFRK